MSHGTDPSHYEVLEVPADVAAQALRQAYRRAAQRHHPDRSAGDPRAQQRMAHINEAYAVLSHPQRRASYDQWMRAREARRAAEASLLAARPSRLAASWPWGLVAATTAFALFTVGTAVYKSTAPAIAAPTQATGH
ncbi:MAG: J domain-containing protein [Ramlibacter sp.]